MVTSLRPCTAAAAADSLAADPLLVFPSSSYPLAPPASLPACPIDLYRLHFACAGYELPGPPKNLVNDPEAWKASVDNARAQLQHQINRIDNLELMVQYGGQAWMKHNENLASLQKAAERQLDDVRQQIEALNWQRQNEQVQAGEELVRVPASHYCKPMPRGAGGWDALSCHSHPCTYQHPPGHPERR